MTKPINSILIHETDNVATAIIELRNGDIARYSTRGEMMEIAIKEHIPQYHKFSVRNIRETELVRKYGETIGRAVRDIGKGAHVHVHNIVSPGR